MRSINIDKDYETLCKWWTAYDFPQVPLDCLPATGLIIDGLCAGFLFKTDSSIAWLSWVIGNKNSDKETRTEAIKQLILGLKQEAKNQGFKHIFSATVHPNLLKVYLDVGFIATDTGVNHVILNMQGES